MSRQRLYSVFWVLRENHLKPLGDVKSTSPDQAVKDWQKVHPESRGIELQAILANQGRRRRSPARTVRQFEFKEFPLTDLNGGDPDWPARRANA